MDNVLKYKGYMGSIDVDLKGHNIYGKILMIDDLVTYESDSVQGLENEFQLAVDDYLETCSQLNITPQKSMSGSFNIRTDPELHRELCKASLKKSITLNSYVVDCIKTGHRSKLLMQNIAKPVIKTVLDETIDYQTFDYDNVHSIESFKSNISVKTG